VHLRGAGADADETHCHRAVDQHDLWNARHALRVVVFVAPDLSAR
jgi:hypothetical protein